MKRIAGVFCLNGEPVDSVRIHNMLVAMTPQPRGNEEIWIKDNMGLGCFEFGGNYGGALHEVNPKSSQSQIIAFNGRIDNRTDLIANLRPDQRCSDQDLILKAYEKWGEDLFTHLVGDFVFALWDEKNRTLHCARDHFGTRPFYYYQDKQKFVFASTPRAILAYGTINPKLNEGRIADFLLDYLEGIDKISSFFGRIFRLPPAHRIKINSQGLTMSRYWELTPLVHLPNTSDQEFVEQFRDLLEEAVRCRLVNSLNPASMLSGGIDSCSIVAMGRRILEKTKGKVLHTFSLFSDEPNLNNRETLHIDAVVKQGKIKPKLITESLFKIQLESILRSIENEDDPFDHLNNSRRSISLEASAENIDAIQDGVDGDLLLVNSDYVAQLWRRGEIGTALGETLMLNGIDVSLKYRLSLFFQSLRSAFIPDWLRGFRRKYQYSYAMESVLKETLINRDFASRVKIGDRLMTFESQRFFPSTATQIVRNINAFDHAFVPAGLERSERISSEFSIEACHPLLDLRLVEFCVGLPWRQKFYRGRTKIILRKAVEPYLPQQVVWRRDKDSLMWYFNKLILQECADYFYQTTVKAMDLMKAYIDAKKLMNCWDGFRKDGDDNNAGYIWTGYALAQWLLKHKSVMD